MRDERDEIAGEIARLADTWTAELRLPLLSRLERAAAQAPLTAPRDFETWARLRLELNETRYTAGRIDAEIRQAIAGWTIEHCIHAHRWTSGAYDTELGPLEDQLDAIESSAGLGPDDTFAEGEEPPEYRAVQDAYDRVLLDLLEQALREFEETELADLLARDPGTMRERVTLGLARLPLPQESDANDE